MNNRQPSAALYTIAGAPLTFDFQYLLFRTPVPPEGNIAITAADLVSYLIASVVPSSSAT